MMMIISKVGDVELLQPLNGKRMLLVPVVTDSGDAIELRFDEAGLQKIWEFLSVLRSELPGAMGVQ